MATQVTMPALGESVSEGTVTTWLKAVGDTVAVDEPLVEVATDKVDSEVPAPVAGVVLEILVQEDETIAVGAPIAVIGDASEATPAAAAPAPAVEAPAALVAPAAVSGTEVTMPALGESVSEGTVTTWLKSIGDRVEQDEALLEVSTDKVDSEVPAPVAGYLVDIRVQEDETVAVGTVVAIIADQPAGAAPTPAAPPVATPAAPVAPAVPAAPQAPIPAAPTPVASAAVAEAHPFPTVDAFTSMADAAASAPVASLSRGASVGYVTPIVRKLARQYDIDLATLTGTGVGGRIRREDIAEVIAAREAAKAAPAAPVAPAVPPVAPAAAAPAQEPSPLRGTTEKMTRLRQTISERMMQSLQGSAQLTTVIEVDVTRLAALRARHKDAFTARENTKLTFLPFFVKAATEALLYHPKINATINGTEVTYHGHENVGIAVDTPKGLFVPVIKAAGEKSLADLARSINDLAGRTRDGKVGIEDLTGGTFTITNTGSGGALFDTPVLNMPETAIMGVGAIVKRPVVVKDADGNDSIAIRSMVYVSLSYDHRLVDGADAARYLMAVKKRLEEANFEADLTA